ncbi:MAG: hypothetical protein V1850_02010 [Candidatus Bathyarchaeota archaeon]
MGSDSEALGKSSPKALGNPALSRAEVVSWLRDAVTQADEKLKLGNTKNNERIKWVRVKLQAASVGALILKDAENEDIEKRLQQLEETQR